MDNFVVVGRSKSQLVEKVCKQLNAPSISFHLDWFADTEPLVTLEQKTSLDKKTALVIFQCNLMFDKDLSHRSINDQIAGFIHLVSAIKQEGAASIIAVLPYLPYARQEKDLTAHHVGPLASWAAIFKAAGIDSIITCDIHSTASASCLGSMLYNVGTTTFWAKHISDLDISKDLCLVSPDHGGIDRVAAIAHELGCDYTFVDKIRLSKDNPIAVGLHGSVANRIAVIVDDIIDTANTAVTACQLLHTHGVRSVFGCFTHAIMSPGACQRLMSAGFEKILITDTLASAIKQVEAHMRVCSIADYLAEHVCRHLETSCGKTP